MAMGSGPSGAIAGGSGPSGEATGAQPRHGATTAAADPSRTQFERICDYLTEQLGVVRQVEAGQLSAGMLLDLAEGELSELKRDIAAARLGATKR